MAAEQIPYVDSTDLFTALKPVRFLKTLQRLQLSGQLVFSELKGQRWTFHLHLGNLIYATGGTHPVRRWQRNLTVHCPQIPAHRLALQHDLAGIDLTNCWEYQLLCLWTQQQKITRQQASNIIHSIIVEVLFDVGQAMDVTNQIQHQQDPSLSKPLASIDMGDAIARVQPFWEAWQDAQLAEYSPNLAPIIKQPEQLQKRRTAEVYQTLTKLLDGKHSLRDLAVQRKRDVVEIARSLLPYLQLRWVELINIPDLPAPTPIRVPVSKPIPASVPQTPSRLTHSAKPLIACVDDSLWVRSTMERLIGAAGYRFIGLDNPLRAIPTLLAQKPDLIFLDLVMPNVNGYEICTQLRKLSCFRNTPIVILTGKNSTADRLRSKFVGATDFLSKPLDTTKLLTVLNQYLNQGAISS
ncbi:MAG TPA: response regulator [Cyanobacteria bacterium UBA8803]|nr:response regulator [Cyanobacteria bacterium UBA9273]HBL60328.1 response regulator [Cyanobacteria bacterium UBA8803]